MEKNHQTAWNDDVKNIVSQMEEKFAFNITDSTTITTLEATKKLFFEQLNNSLNEMKESGLWYEEELQLIANKGADIIRRSHIAAYDYVRSEKRKNWVF